MTKFSNGGRRGPGENTGRSRKTLSGSCWSLWRVRSRIRSQRSLLTAPSTATPICASPRLRTAPTGSGVFFQRIGRAYGQMPGAFPCHPQGFFFDQVFVAPSYEDDMDDLATLMPAERILFGSDFPHSERLDEPLTYLEKFKNFRPDQVKRIFHANLKGLLEGARD
jgi:hypothetical protein